MLLRRRTRRRSARASKSGAWRLEDVLSRKPHRRRRPARRVRTSGPAPANKVRPRTVFNCHRARGLLVRNGCWADLSHQRRPHGAAGRGARGAQGVHRLRPCRQLVRIRRRRRPVRSEDSGASRQQPLFRIQSGSVQPDLHYAGQEAGFSRPSTCAFTRSTVPSRTRRALFRPRCSRPMEGRAHGLRRPGDLARLSLHVDDACEAFIRAAAEMREEHYGRVLQYRQRRSRRRSAASRGRSRTTVPPGRGTPASPCRTGSGMYRTLVRRAPARPRPTLAGARARSLARRAGRDGPLAQSSWKTPDRYRKGVQRRCGLDETHSVSAIVACYKDAQAIPIMYARLKAVFRDAEHRPRDHLRERLLARRQPGASSSALSAADRHVSSASRTRATSGRRRPSAAAWRRRPRTACVLLDGDLQDPPELIEEFVAQMAAGFRRRLRPARQARRARADGNRL